MCGIAGFCDFNELFSTRESHWIDILKNMRQSISHRGGDASGEWLSDHIGFSHARLSIRDIPCGAQPMTRQRAQKECAIIYNGEIYNTEELIPSLKKAGYEFQTTSDTEVLLYSYLHYGSEFVKKLNGIFAFAIWDGRSESLLLYRDRVGTKPLFYTLQENTLIFGSEPKALFEHPKVTPRINADSLREVLALGPAHTPGNGIFCGLKEVLPGHYLSFSRLGFIDHTYWDLTSHPHMDSYSETAETVSYLVRDAITRQMVSDVPVCTFLSGGIDSSIVTAVAANYLSEKGEILNSFSFDFEENDKYFKSNIFQPERDLPYVNIMLKHYHTNHAFLECEQSALSDLLYAAVDAKDMPGMTDIDSSLLYFCSIVARHNKVALTGECADEIFGGYPWFYREELLNRNGFPWSLDMDARTALLDDTLCKELELSEYSYSRYQDTIAKTPVLPGESPENARRRQIGYLNIKWFMQTLLDRMDRTSMYSGLEARVPFADHRIIEYVFNVPWEMKYQNGVEKALLREACKDLLPNELLYRKKSPYPKTYHPAYEKRLVERLRAIVENPNAPITPLINKEKALIFIHSHKELGKPWYGQLMAGPQLMAYYIQLNYWMEKYHLSI